MKGREVALSRSMTKNIENLTILYYIKCGVLQGVLRRLRKNRYCKIALIFTRV